MRLIMMGTGPFAVPTFRALLASDHVVPLLVTRPAHVVRTRGRAPRNPMREVAEQQGLEVFDPEDVNRPEARETLASQDADLLVVCDYGQILSKATLSVTRLGGINLHGSLLPKYRGAAPVQWALLCGEHETGVTVIHMTPRLDAGPCFVQRVTRIGDDETAAELEPRLAELGVEAVHAALALLAGWDGRSQLGTRQDPSLSTRAPRLSKADGDVDWSRSAAQIRNQVRALKPWPGTFTHWLPADAPPLRIILDHVSVEHGGGEHRAGEHRAGEPGEVLQSDGRLWIATGAGAVAVDRLQPAGKRVMDVTEFLRGHRVSVGDRFGSPTTSG